MAAIKKIRAVPSKSQSTSARFGHFDPKSGEWLGRAQELGVDEVIMDAAHPDYTHTVQRIQSGVLALYQSKRIGDAEVVAANRWHKDWSVGTGHPLRCSEARFLGVSLGGAGSADGIPTSQIDAATRHREAAEAVGARAAQRLMAFVVLGHSLSAASALLGVSRQDLGGEIIGDLQRLAEHYAAVATDKHPGSWNQRSRS